MFYQFGAFRLRLDRRTLTKNRKEISVEPQVFDIIAYFVTHPDRVITRDELLQNIWEGRAVSDSAISTRINQARTVLGDTGRKQSFIKTVHNKGFRFIAKPEFIDCDDKSNISTGDSDAASLEPSPPPAARQSRSHMASFALGASFFFLGGLSTLGIQRMTSVSATAPAPNIDITKYALGDEIIGVPGRNTLDLSSVSGEGYMVGLTAGAVNPRSQPLGRTIFKLQNIQHIIGSPHDDWLRGTVESNIFKGGDGDDFLQGYDGVDYLYGGDGDDVLNGGYFVDEVFGGPGNDSLVVATDSPGDNADGGDGIDTLDLSKFTYSGYNVDLDAGQSFELLERDMGIFKLSNIENIIGTPQGDVLAGDDLDNVISGNGGIDTIDGRGGQDTASFSGPRADYILTRLKNGSVEIKNSDTAIHKVTIRNIEFLQFSDGVYDVKLVD